MTLVTAPLLLASQTASRMLSTPSALAPLVTVLVLEQAPASSSSMTVVTVNEASGPVGIRVGAVWPEVKMMILRPAFILCGNSQPRRAYRKTKRLRSNSPRCRMCREY